MAATRILALLLLLLCLHLEKPIMQESLPNFLLSVQKSCCVDPGVRDDAVFLHGPRSCVRFVTRRSRHARLRYPVLVWHKHGLLTIASSDRISVWTYAFVWTWSRIQGQTTASSVRVIRLDLLRIRNKTFWDSANFQQADWNLCLLLFRNWRCLIFISIEAREPTVSRTVSEFAVPKFLFTSICSLAKTKNRVRAAVALEADLNNEDIDVCIVSESHLKPEMPDAIVNIPGYSIFRQDRNWSGLDKRSKGGIAIYGRSNLNIIDVYRSKLYELLYVILKLPSGHLLLTRGIYHPPKPTYQPADFLQ